MNRRLTNWALVFAGNGAPKVAQVREDESRTPHVADAQKVEEALLALKQHRNQLWWAVQECYVHQREDISAADAQRVSVSTYRNRLSAAYDALFIFLKGRLD